MSAVSGLMTSTAVSVMTDLPQYTITLADSNAGSGLCYSTAEYFCQMAYDLWQTVGDFFFFASLF
jgi:hypothetical protein